MEVIHIEQIPYRKLTKEELIKATESDIFHARRSKKKGWYFCKPAKNACRLVRICPEDIFTTEFKNLSDLVNLFPKMKKAIPYYNQELMNLFYPEIREINNNLCLNLPTFRKIVASL